MTEEWRPIAGWEGLYEVSSLGRVRNRAGLVKRPQQHQCGYLQMSLYRPGAAETRKVHRLVAMAFIPNPLDKREVNHIDTVRTNNVVENLEWVDKWENHDHSSRLGKYHAATNPRRCKKLSIEQADACRLRHASGEGIADLAREHGVTYANMQRRIIGRASQSKRVIQKDDSQ